MDPDLADAETIARLMAAIPTYPTFGMVCASVGLSSKTVENWIRRGQQADAPIMLQTFSRRFLELEADHARQLYQTFLGLVARGKAGAAQQLLHLMDRRFKLVESRNILEALGSGKKRTDDLDAMLRAPSPRFRAALARNGWERSATWQPSLRLLAAAPESDDTEG